MEIQTIIYHSNDVITSFSTKHPKALIKKVPWVISTAIKMTDAVSRIFDDGYADLVVIHPHTGNVIGLLSDFENTTTLSSKAKKKKKWDILGQQQEDCHKMCVDDCKDRGGCKMHAIIMLPSGEITCAIQCFDGLNDTLGEVLDQGAP